MKYLLILILSCLTLLPGYAQVGQLSDEFDQNTLDDWSRVNAVEGWNADQLEAIDINQTESGALMMMPYTCGWFNNRRAPLVFKLVNSRSFALTTSVTVTNRAGDGIPSSIYSLAGLMVRTPIDYPNGALQDWQAGQENYVFLSCGHAQQNVGMNPTQAPPPHFEVKTTVNSNSTLEISGISTLENVIIRLVRIDDTILALYKLPGQDYVLHRRYDRPDFPDALQAGFVTYTDWSNLSDIPEAEYNQIVVAGENYPNTNPDLIAYFDYARFQDLEVPAELSGVDLYSEATDQQLLGFLGEALDEGPNPDDPTLDISDVAYLEFFPNPVYDDRIRIQSDKQMAGIQVLNASGRVVKQVMLDGFLQIYDLDVRDLKPGLMLMQVQMQDGSEVVRRFLKK